MKFYDLFTIVPAAHQKDAQFLAYIWLQQFKCTDTVDKILNVGVSPTGENPPTHYICARKVNENFLQMHLEENRNRSAKAFDWCHSELTTDKNIALTKFAMLIMTEEEGLNFLGLKKCK